MSGPRAKIVPAHGPAHLPAVRAIFAEYARAIAPLAADSLAHQGFDAELEHLPGAYAPPRGALLLAVSADADAAGRDERGPVADAGVLGCVAVRPWPALGQDACELKRMYVRPAARGLGVGRLLAEAALNASRAAGYARVVLDTSSSMHEAKRLYASLGFRPRARYNDDPMADTEWFELLWPPREADERRHGGGGPADAAP